jgi:hypothetical protein
MIIDQLAGDLRSLRVCALLCRRWRPRSQHQLFKSIEFTGVRAGRSIHRWSTTFPANEGMEYTTGGSSSILNG